MADSFRVLHLSDFHVGKAPDPQKTCFASIVAHVKEQEPPDLIAITGDIANHGKAKEYDTFKKEFLNPLKAALDEDWKGSILVVPGNHDVNRDEVEHFGDGIYQWAAKPEFHAINAKGFKRRKALFDGIKAYADANLGDVPGDWLLSERGFATHVPQSGSGKIGCLLLNTAWVCHSDKDRNHTGPGQYAVAAGLEELEDCSLVFALGHHPLHWWQDRQVEDVCGHWGKAGNLVFLYGHVHQELVNFEDRGSKGFITLGAGSAYQDEESRAWPNGFQWYTVDLAQGKLHIDPFTWNRANKRWKVNSNTGYPDQYETSPTRWSIDLPGVQGGAKNADTPITEPAYTGPLIPGHYARFLTKCCSQLDTLARMDRAVAWDLQRLYVPLKTDWLSPEQRAALAEQTDDKGERNQPEPRPLTELASHPTYRHFAIQGHPGGGKSTFMRFVAMMLLERGTSLPLLLPLKAFGGFLSRHQGQHAGLLCQWAGEHLEDQGLDAEALRARQGRLVWLLDGLDEIFDQRLRQRAAEIIGAWCMGAGEQDRLLMTSRPHALEQQGLLSALHLGIDPAWLLPLDEQGQNLFLKRWFGNLLGPDKRELAEELHESLWHALESQPMTAKLRDNPLMLSVMATIYHQGGYLPDCRVELYNWAIDLMLQRRFGNHHEHGGQETVRRMRLALERIALKIQMRGGSRDIGRGDFLDCLRDAYFYGRKPNLEQQAELETQVARLECHSGLLQVNQNGAVLSFAHRGYQEYLAARCLAADSDPFEAVADKLNEDSWHEVILLIVGHLFQIDQSPKGHAFLNQLREQCTVTKGCKALALVLNAAAEAPKGSMDPTWEKSLTSEAVRLIQSGDGEEKERAEVGLALGRLGDPRIDVYAEHHWVPSRIPKGWEDGDGKRVAVTTSYRMARYPITNQTYRGFMKAGGYTNTQWWSEEGLNWKDDYDGWLKAFELEDAVYLQPDSKPRFWRNQQFNQNNQPVVGVSFYEAQAFCAWLTRQFELKRPEWWQSGMRVVLPNETHWYFSAAGRDKREYPWIGDALSAVHANYGARLGRPSSVGLYPAGSSPEGLMDLAGNVWEWQCNLYEPDNPAVRALRGGSWSGGARSLAASFRGLDLAGVRNYFVGFRAVLVLPSEQVP